MDERPEIKSGGNLMQEADLGSGEKSPGQEDTEAEIEQIGKVVQRPAEHPAASPTPPAKP